MEIRSTRSFIPATLIRGVFNLYLSNLLCKMYMIVNILFTHLFIVSFSFNHCKFFLICGKRTLTYLLTAHTPLNRDFFKQTDNVT